MATCMRSSPKSESLVRSKKMESLYSKLYDKYTKLKTRKESEIDRHTRDQEEKFLNYSSAAEELIVYLRDENSRLHDQINYLKKEVASARYDREEQCLEYQQRLDEETTKTKELSEEVERLHEQEKLCCCSKDGNNEKTRLESLEHTQLTPRVLLNDSSRKRPAIRDVAAERDEARDPSYGGDSCRGLPSDDNSNIQQGNCCRRKTVDSGDASNAFCMFQTLLECLVGMEFTLSDRKEGSCLSAVHQSSGYSFDLIWISKAAEESSELRYHVTSLGTFEKVAPEWMREDLIFSTSMCLLFFKRLSPVIGLHL